MNVGYDGGVPGVVLTHCRLVPDRRTTIAPIAAQTLLTV